MSKGQVNVPLFLVAKAFLCGLESRPLLKNSTSLWLGDNGNDIAF